MKVIMFRLFPQLRESVVWWFRARILYVHPFCRICFKVAAFKNNIGLSILAYGWHGGSDVLIVPSIFVAWVARRSNESSA
jgi:hypothetical protein